MSLSLPHPGDLPGGVAAAWRRWLVALLCVGGAVAALGALFPAEIVGAYRVWTGSTAFSHCFLILPLALYLVWDRRGNLAHVAPRPTWWALPLMPILSGLWLVAAVLGVLELQQLVLLSMAELLLLVVLGRRIFLMLLGPFLYLFLLVPTGEFLVPTLQDFTARFVVSSLHLAGVPVFSDGILIQIPEGDFMVAEACAGLRFLIASIAFGTFFALIVYRSWKRRLCFVAISLIVPIVANGIRAFGIVYLAHVANDVIAVEADHVIYGWGFFGVVMLALIAIGLRFADDRGAPARPAAAPPPAAPPGALALVTFLLLVGAGLGPAYAAFLDAPDIRSDLSSAAAPAVAAPWQAADLTSDRWRPILVAPDRTFHDAWTAGGKQVQRYLALYTVAGRHNNLVRSQNRIVDETHWTHATVGRAAAVIDGRPVEVNAAIISASGQRRLVWYAYIVDGHVTASVLDAKLRQARAILFGRSSCSAFLALATDVATDPEQAAVTLGAFAAAMAPMNDYLGHVAGHRP